MNILVNVAMENVTFHKLPNENQILRLVKEDHLSNYLNKNLIEFSKKIFIYVCGMIESFVIFANIIIMAPFC